MQRERIVSAKPYIKSIENSSPINKGTGVSERKQKLPELTEIEPEQLAGNYERAFQPVIAIFTLRDADSILSCID